jgi:Heparinase II/III-like protein/Heparinase II/III N-terminus
VIRERAGRLLSKWRRANVAVAAPPAPPRRWFEDLSEAGLTAVEWLAARQAAGRLFVDLSDERVDRLRRRHPALVQATIAAGERVLRHEFDLLGSGPYTPADPDRSVDESGYRPIDWFLDPVAGLRFPRGVPLDAWNFEQMRPAGADIKLPWELARCQHWPLLGQAYRLTRDDRFAAEIARELRDFMDANPVGTAVNWTCTMDVALRAANWALALELIRAAELPGDFWITAYTALFDHGAFIERHLENQYEVTSNHFLSNVVGLFYVAAVFRDLPRGTSWDHQCRAWLTQEMDVQVLPDGADYESSIPYHRLVSELFLGAARVADISGSPLPARFLSRLSAMIDFLAAVLRPDGLMPQVGDADDGRLHILSGYGAWKPQDARHLFGPAASLFQRSDWAAHAGTWGDWESAWWGFDPSRLEPPQAVVANAMRHFPDAGLTVMRRHRDYLLITNGVVGTGGFGNHKHNDLLGFEYHIDGHPVIVDPGSFVYTSDPDARNLFRSTRSHNTLCIDDDEQNEIRPEWLFRMFEKASPELVSLRDDRDALEYRGRHYGYARLREPIVHDRTFTLGRSDGSLAIADMLEGRGRHRLRWHFHFAPGVAIELAAPDVLEIVATTVRLQMRFPSSLTASIACGWYSPSYGVRQRCTMLDLDAVASVDGRRDYTFQLISG